MFETLEASGVDLPSEIVHVNITKAAIIESRRRPGGAIIDEISEGILKGVIDPDKTPDRYSKIHSGEHWHYYHQTKREIDHYSSHVELVNYYFNLSLYHLRKNMDRFKAGFMLGRALHYVQDESFERAISKYSGELVASPERIIDLCRVTFVGKRKKSSLPEEAICIALKKSVELLGKFIEEYRKPVNVRELEEKIRRIRLMKMIVFSITLALILLKLPNLLFQLALPTTAVAFVVLYVVVLIGVSIANYRPKAYHEAVRAGLRIEKPHNYEPAY